MSLLLNHSLREGSLSFQNIEFLSNKHIFLSTPSVGAEFLVDGSMFLHTPSVGAAYICGCMWSWSWEHDKSLNKGQQDLIKLNTITSSICGRFLNLLDIIFGFGRNCSPVEEYVILWFYIIFIKTNSPITLNRNGWVSKSELYHTSQQPSQHDCPIRKFSHKHKCMYMEQTSCKLLS
jgi:hypothetical protein